MQQLVEHWPLLAALIGTGVFAGLLAGLLGIGGGIVIVPMLHAVCIEFGQPDTIALRLAVATSLSTIVVTSLSAALSHAHRGAVDRPLLRTLSPFVFAGAVAGTLIASWSSGPVLRLVFACVLFLMAARTVFARGGTLKSWQPGFRSLASIGAGIGALAAMMGIGGGLLSAPLFRKLGLNPIQAVGTAAPIGAIVAVPATLGYMLTGWGVAALPPGSIGYVNLLAFVCLVPITVVFAPIGARLAHNLPGWVLDTALAAILVVLAVRMLGGVS